MPLCQGMVMVWDNFTALSAITDVLVNAAFQATIATQTVTANASTASYAAQGLINVNGVTYNATQSSSAPQAYVNLGTGPLTMYYGGLSGSTFTAAFSPITTATSGVPINGTIFNAPQGGNFAPIAGLPAIATASDSGRLVTFSTKTTLASLAGADQLIAGVVSPDGTAGTSMLVIQPNNPMFLAVAGAARTYIANATVAAAALLTTSATIIGGAGATGTLGNLLGISLEAQSAIDKNNTIRSFLKLG
jgi:hypothetical protein